MTWPEISTEDFPPRRDDEPSSLRQDIIDELSDHFVCALNRELLKNPDERLARKRVLERFGDPIKVARQLWLEAMKEKVMSQRILVGISAVMAVCCIAVVGIAWSMMKQSEQVNLKLLERLAVMEEQPRDAGTQQILTQLEQLKAEQAAQSESSSQEMNPITFQLIQKEEGGKPAVGFSGDLAKLDDSGVRVSFRVTAESGPDGRLEFGKLPWGKYNMTLRAPWREEYTTGILTTIPGRKFEQTIYCPDEAPGKVPVQFQVNWPEKPTGEAEFLLCDFRAVRGSLPVKTFRYSLGSYRRIQNCHWSYRHNMTQEAARGVYLIDVQNQRATPCPVAEDGSFADIDFEKLVWQPTVETLQGEYFAPHCFLLRKDELTRLSKLNSIKAFGVIVRNRNSIDLKASLSPGQGMFISPFETLRVEPKFLSLLKKMSHDASQVIHAFESQEYLVRYDATIQGPNVWEINVPDLFPITRESGLRNTTLQAEASSTVDSSQSAGE